MFYCEECREYNNWPQSFTKSIGNCEICNERAVCYDKNHNQLPPHIHYLLIEQVAKYLAELVGQGKISTYNIHLLPPDSTNVLITIDVNNTETIREKFTLNKEIYNNVIRLLVKIT